MRQKLEIITQYFRLPSICILCHQFHNNSLAVCADCIHLFQPLGFKCQYCAHPLPESTFLTCGHCIQQRPHFNQAFVQYRFEEPLRSLLHEFKYHGGFYLNSLFVHLMLNALPKSIKPDCLIPVPMHPTRLKQRGFNQSALLTRALAHHLNLPYDLGYCIKKVNTAAQVDLNREQRKKNLRHSFEVIKSPLQHVILIDDLLTTGSTANELALTLKQAGVKRVDVWCCARTV